MVGAWGRALQRNRKTGLQLRLAFSCCVTLCQLFNLSFPRASLVAQRLKRLPTMWETWVLSLGWEDSPGEGNGNPLQYSCLEKPMDGVAKSRTRLSE